MIFGTQTAASKDGGVTLISFSPEQFANVSWSPLTDQLRGGRSWIDLKLSNQLSALITGELFLIDGAGFSSVRFARTKEPKIWDLSSFGKVIVRVKGDGRLYRILLKDLNMAESIESYSYEASFMTNSEVQEIHLPLASFVATRRGRALPNAPPLVLSQIVEIGLQINDKIEAPFAIELFKIEAE